MKLGGIRSGKKNMPAEELETQPQELSEQKSAPKKKLRLTLPKLDRETIEKQLEKLLKPRKKRKKRKIRISLRKAIEIVLILFACFMMISPLSYNVFSDEDFVSRDVAKEVSLADSGVAANKAAELKCDMIKLDDLVCYKVEFTSGINGYKYIVNADSGEIIAQAFYQIEKDESSN